MEDIELGLNIDYLGCEVDEVEEKLYSLLGLRLHIKEYGVMYGERYLRHAVNISTGPHNNLEEAVEEIITRADKWFSDRHMTHSVRDKVEGNKDLQRKFVNWLSMRPELLSKVATLEVNL